MLQGGFRFANPADAERQQAGLLSLGPLVLGGVRHRTVLPGDGVDACVEAVYVLLGARGTRRTATRISARQRRHVVVFFVFSECVDADETCIAGASEAVAVAGCSGAIHLNTRRGITGKAKVRCRRGIDVTGAAFGLSTAEQDRLAQAFPDLGRRVRLRLRDRAGREVTGETLRQKIANLDPQALDDVVGTYLADDQLPACGP